MTTKATSETFEQRKQSVRFEASLRPEWTLHEDAIQGLRYGFDSARVFTDERGMRRHALDPTTPQGALEAMGLLNLASTPFYVDLEIPLRATGIQKWRVWELGHPMQTPWFPSLPEAVADRWNTAATQHARKGEKG